MTDIRISQTGYGIVSAVCRSYRCRRQANGDTEIKYLESIACKESVRYGELTRSRRIESPGRCSHEICRRSSTGYAEGTIGICRITTGCGRARSRETKLIPSSQNYRSSESRRSQSHCEEQKRQAENRPNIHVYLTSRRRRKSSQKTEDKELLTRLLGVNKF